MSQTQTQSQSNEFIAVVLAAGQGTRMKSRLPKVLHPIAGRPLVTWSLRSALDAGVSRCVVVVGHASTEVEAAVKSVATSVSTVVQREQRGTGDAVRVAMAAPELSSLTGRVLVLYGDCPLIRVETLAALMTAARNASGPLAMLTARLEDPTGYGRILRNSAGHVIAIREHRDCSPEERKIDEVNPGVYAIDASFLRDALTKLVSNNAQGELYLTDVVERAAAVGPVASVEGDIDELRGVNDQFELALSDKLMRRRIARTFALSGVVVRDPDSAWIDADTTIEPGATIEPNVTLRGRCSVGTGARIDVGCVFTDVDVRPGAYVKPYTVATSSIVGENAQVGPFSHLRPATELGPDAHVGNFVETKKTRMGRGSKANHLAYLGDGNIGENVNVGAGTIFCNYDGYKKHETVLEDGAFIGSDSQIVAPVRVGKNAYVATGTTVTRDVPEDALAVGRARQENKEGYARKLRAKLQTKKT